MPHRCRHLTGSQRVRAGELDAVERHFDPVRDVEVDQVQPEPEVRQACGSR